MIKVRSNQGVPRDSLPFSGLGGGHATNEVLSPSQVRCFMDCQMRWWFKYGLRVPDAPNGEHGPGQGRTFLAR